LDILFSFEYNDYTQTGQPSSLESKVYIVQYVQQAVRGNQDEKKKQNPTQIRCTRQLLSEKSI
jgi:hypothetical protein